MKDNAMRWCSQAAEREKFAICSGQKKKWCDNGKLKIKSNTYHFDCCSESRRKFKNTWLSSNN